MKIVIAFSNTLFYSPNGRKEMTMPRIICSTLIVMAAVVMSACAQEISQSNSAVADVFNPTPQVLENTPALTSGNDTAKTFSSDQLGLCFSYPSGFGLVPSNIVEVAALEPTGSVGSETKGLFWLEISDSFDRTAEEIADEEMTYAAGLAVSRWTMTIGGEEAVVLDGMPGQDFQRRVYVVHEQALYVLAFMPTRLENNAAVDQMEALYSLITKSWRWSPC